MQKWYIVKVTPGHERKVKRTLDEAIQSKGFSEVVTEVLVPSEQVTDVKNGKQRTLEKRTYPGYIFLKMDLNDDSHSFIKQVTGIRDFLGGSKPQALTDHEMSDMLQQVEDRQKSGGHLHAVKVGDKVRITQGPFMSYTGTVTEADADKTTLKVSVNIFDRETPVTLEHSQIEAVTEGQ